MACSGEPKETVAKKERVLFSGGAIYTANDKSKVAEAMVIQGTKVVFAGGLEDAKNFAPDAEQVDLHGKVITPGFMDGHAHPGLVGIFGGMAAEDETSIPYGSKEEILDWLRAYSQTPGLPLLISMGEWDVEAFLPEGPHKKDLDQIFPDRPVILSDNSGHSFWFNSVALQMFGVTKDTPDVSEGISMFQRDEKGEPTGWVKEFALMREMGVFLGPEKEDLKAGIAEYLTFLSKAGVTTLYDAGNFVFDDAVYEVLAELEAEGRLPLRYYGSFHIWHPEQIHEAVNEVKRLNEAYGGKRLTINTVKIHFDGVAEIGTAGMLEPYVIEEGNTGGILFNRDELAGLIVRLNEEGIHLHLHVVGDRATRVALNAVEEAGKQIGDRQIEVTLSHLETVSEEDIERFKALNVHANFTPHWFGGTHFGGAGAIWLGEERAKRQQLAGVFEAAGANVTLSSDVVTGGEAYRAPPLIGLQMAVTRREFSDDKASFYGPEEALLEREDAFMAYTQNVAKQLGIGERRGSLEVGKSADFLVFEKDIMAIDVHELHGLSPNTVYFEGEKLR